MRDHRFVSDTPVKSPHRRNPWQGDSEGCRWQRCQNKRAARYGLNWYLCQEHSLHVWDTIASDLEVMDAHQAAIQRRREEAEARAERQSQPPTPGWIYFLRIGEHIKIGHATHLGRRMAAYPPNTEFLAAVPGTRKDEQNIHLRLAEHRAMGREWYTLRADVLALVEKAQRNPDRVKSNPFDKTDLDDTNPSGVQLRARTLRRMR